jgi:hypothetical protein
MLMVIVDRCADAALPPPDAGSPVAAGVAGPIAVRCPGTAEELEFAHAESASAATAPAARSLMIMVLHPKKPQWCASRR